MALPDGCDKSLNDVPLHEGSGAFKVPMVS